MDASVPLAVASLLSSADDIMLVQDEIYSTKRNVPALRGKEWFMTMIVSLLVGMLLGVSQSLLAWWLLYRRIGPKLSWGEPNFVRPIGNSSYESDHIVVYLRNQGRRNVIDLSLHAELRVDHSETTDGVTRTVIRLPLNSRWAPRLRRGGEIRIRVEIDQIPKYDWERLYARTRINTCTVVGILHQHASASLRFYALAYDEFSGARRLFVSRDIGGSELGPRVLSAQKSLSPKEGSDSNN